MQDFTLPLIAIHISGFTQLFNSVEDAARFRGRFALQHRTPETNFVWSNELQDYRRVHTGRYHESEWILRDDSGRAISASDLPQLPQARRSRPIDRQKARAIELGIAVPLPRDISWGSFYGRYRWNQRFRQEESDNRFLRHEARSAGIPVDHFGRRRRIAPVPYESADWRKRQRSWKKHRRTQWKEVSHQDR